MTFGLVPHPAYQNRLVTDAQNGAWDDLGKKWIGGVVWHRMVGSLSGTDGWFRRGAASNGLTSYGVGCAAMDGASLAGVIYVWNDPRGYAYPGISPNRAPWASGVYSASASFGDGQAFVNEFGVNAVNAGQAAIEISGNYDTPLDDKCRASICALTAFWADQNKIPYDVFPQWPGHDYSFVRWHVEFCGEAEKPCPGTVVRNETDALIEQTRAILTQYQSSGTTPDEEDPLADISKSAYELDPNLIWPNASTGAVGKVWRAYGEATGIFNPPGQPWNDAQTDGTKLFQFEGGPLVATTKDGKTGIVVKVS